MKTRLAVLFLILFSSAASAQFFYPKQNEGLLYGGAGIQWIDGQPFYTIHFQPELMFTNVGIGLDLNLSFGADGKLRKENFNEFSDYLSIIRYIRYGQKGDPFYAKLGALDYATLGHGSIMYLYNNSPSFDTRKVGVELDVDFNDFGFESVYGNFGQAGVLGMRGYLRPLQFTQLADVPILGRLEAGATISADLNDNAGVVAGNYDASKNLFTPTLDEGNIVIMGLDLGLPVLRTGLINLDLYYDFAHIAKFGSGSALGIMADFKGFGLLNVKARLERRFNGDNYIPSYFNSFYEIERFNLDTANGTVVSKVQQLKAGVHQSNGYYGEAIATLLGTFKAIASFQKLDKEPDSGILHAMGEFSQSGFPYMARFGYDKINIKDMKDLFTLDDRSYLFFEFGYKATEYLVMSMVYYWTYAPMRDANDKVVGYRTQRRIEPRISFYYPLNFGGN